MEEFNDKIRNEDNIGPKELLVISFGTSFNENRSLTIGAVEQAMEDAFPDYSIRRAFTSPTVIRHIATRDHVVIDNMAQALDRAIANGVKTLVVQPTHLMSGREYTALSETLSRYASSFEKVALGMPVLHTDEDFNAVIDAIVEDTKEYDDGETAICFMGHGTRVESNMVYTKMQKMMDDRGIKNRFIATVEATPTLEDLLAAVSKGSYKKAVLQPLMLVAGDHANNDMAGDGEDSWASAFLAAGYDVNCVIRGLGEIDSIQQLLVQHAKAAMDSLK